MSLVTYIYPVCSSSVSCEEVQHERPIQIKRKWLNYSSSVVARSLVNVVRAAVAVWRSGALCFGLPVMPLGIYVVLICLLLFGVCVFFTLKNVISTYPFCLLFKVVALSFCMEDRCPLLVFSPSVWSSCDVLIMLVRQLDISQDWLPQQTTALSSRLAMRPERSSFFIYL